MLQDVTRQQIRQAITDGDLTSLRLWVLLLCTAAAWCDPATDQITSPGLNRFLQLHAGRGLSIRPCLDELPPPALIALALLASNTDAFPKKAR